MTILASPVAVGKRKKALLGNIPLYTSLTVFISIIKKYIKRLPIEVYFKEYKQMLGFEKDQSKDFNGQVNSSIFSFLRCNILNYHNVAENYSTMGRLFENSVDEAAVKSNSA